MVGRILEVLHRRVSVRPCILILYNLCVLHKPI